MALNPDVCVEDGGTAECVAPEIGDYRYATSSSTWGGWWVASEQAAIDYVHNQIATGVNACTSHVEMPGWIPLPSGPLGQGGQNVGDPNAAQQDVGDYWSQSWNLGVETQQIVWTLRVKGTSATTSNPPCASNFSYGLQFTRQRTVECPVGYQPNGYTSPTYSYCWRYPVTGNDKAKNLGPCKDCDLMVSNPVNVATGNKYQEERDYAGTGPFPLEYVRRYNSLAWKYWTPPTVGPNFLIKSPNWRGTYDRAVLHSDNSTFPTARAYRHDGRVLSFKLSGGQWVADADVDERLTRQVDGSGNTTGWTLATPADEIETYDVNGRLVTLRNRAGITHTLAYNANGQLISVTHSFGQQLTFTYDGNDRVATMTAPGSAVFTFGYAAPGNLTSVTYPDTRVRTYHYESGSWYRALTGITDESSVRFSTYSYDGYGMVSQSQHAGTVNRYQFSYPSSTSTVVTDPLNTARTWTLTSVLGSARASAISAVCSTCRSASKTKTFDANGNLDTRTDFNDNETRFDFNLTRNLETSRTEAYATAKARTITTDWHSTFRLPTEIEGPNRTTTFTHDSNGNVLTRTVTDTTVTPNASRTWTYTYNSVGRVLTANGPRTDVTDVTTNTYYSCSTGYQCGQVQTITNALGHVTTYNTYNAHGQPLTITDPNGLVTTLTYDSRQRLTSQEADGETTSFEYWPTGLLKKVTLPDTSFLLYTYDNAHRLTQVSDSENNRIVYTLDAAGNRTKEETFDPSNYLVRLHHRAFNTLNQLWKDIGAANTSAVTTTFGFDDNGNQTSANAPLSRNTSNLYDELNRLKQITDPASGITLIGYDPNDNLTSVTDPRGKVTSYVYSGFGDLKQQTSPDTGVTDHVYDSGGNLSTATDARGKTGTYSYDSLNRVTQLSFPDQTIGYSYDTGTNNKGRLM